MNQSVIFLQKQTHRAGAQTCLLRLLQHPDLKAWSPTVVSAQDGWLTTECSRLNIPVLREVFPSSRTWLAQLFLNRIWARKIAAKLKIPPRIVHANDHSEGLLGLTLAQCWQAKTALFLRSSGMSRKDFFKYGCHQYDLVGVVGDELFKRAREWSPDQNIQLIHDGINRHEIVSPKPKASQFPQRILVIGNSGLGKGWTDLTEALWQLQGSSLGRNMEFHFTGNQPDWAKNSLQLERLQGIKFNFLGRVEQFSGLIRQYDLVINPTRQESFGMAAIEVLIAGVPLLSSRTGIIEQVQENTNFLFPPGQPGALADRLKDLADHWSQLDTSVARAQENIRNKFLVDYTAQKLCTAYNQLLASGRV